MKKKKLNKALRALLIFNGLFVFASGFLGPLYAVFVETIDANVFSISLSWAVFLLSSTFFTLFLIPFGDGIFSKRQLFLAGMLVRIIVWPLFIFVDNIGMLLVVQFLLGFGEALGTPAFRALFAAHLDAGRQVAEYSMWKLVVDLSSAIGVLIGGLIVSSFGFPALFISMSGVSLIAFVFLAIRPRNFFN